jgi:uncharacterized membrane protein
MLQQVNKMPRPRILTIVRGIIDDAKQLVLGQYELRKYQVEREVTKAKAVATSAAIGMPVAAIGALLLLLTIVHLLNEVAGLPLWASYGIVSVVLLVIGGAFLLAAKKKMRGVGHS